MKVTNIIDGNSIGYAEQYATKLHSGGMETQAVFGFIRKMREMRQAFPTGTPLVLWDGRAQWRFDLWPAYKSNREDDPKKRAIKEAYVLQRPYIARALEHLGIRQLTALDAEADDMAGYLTAQIAANPNNKVFLHTGDHDWMQLVRPNVIWMDSRAQSHNFVSHQTFLEKTGYANPIAFLEGKCLHGDSSDVIPGVGGIGKDTAPQFLAEHGSVRDFFRKVDDGSYQPKTRKSKDAKTLHPEQLLASMEGRKAFVRNVKLMQLQKVAKPDPKRIIVTPGKLDKDKFAEVCEELAFTSVLKSLDNFLLPF